MDENFFEHWTEDELDFYIKSGCKKMLYPALIKHPKVVMMCSMAATAENPTPVLSLEIIRKILSLPDDIEIKMTISDHPVSIGKVWIGKEADETATQEFTSDEMVYLSNEPTYWQFGYSEDGRSFTFMPDYLFEGILSRFLDTLEEEGTISISKAKDACYHDFLNKKFKETVK